jgi:hypothetical protein
VANLRKEIRALLARKKRDDTVLVALAGHGIQGTVKEGGKEKDESFFCPSDAQLNDNDTLISLSKLFSDLSDCGAGVKLLLVDACRNDPKLGRNADPDNLPRPPRGTAALFSCRGGERAFETDKLGDRGHGIFFHFVLEGLRGKAKNEDNEVTWDRLTEFVKRQVSRQVPKVIGDGAKQTPHLLANLEGESPVLVRIDQDKKSAAPKLPEGIANSLDSAKRILVEDFKSTKTGELPRGWKGDDAVAVRLFEGKRYLTTSGKGPDSIKTPKLRIEGDFTLEVTFLMGAGNKLELKLLGADGTPDLELSLDNGYLAFLKVAGKKYRERFVVSAEPKNPTRLRLQRKGEVFEVIDLNKDKTPISERLSKYKTFQGLEIGLTKDGNPGNATRIRDVKLDARSGAEKN